MATECRAWWRNCAVEADAEILEVDALEDRIGPIDAETTKVRELISTLELCHHKAERWVQSIIEAVGAGKTEKGLGTRRPVIFSLRSQSRNKRVWYEWWLLQRYFGRVE